MRLANLIRGGVETPCVAGGTRGWIPLDGLVVDLPSGLAGLVATGLGEAVRGRLMDAVAAAPDHVVIVGDGAKFTPVSASRGWCGASA